MRIALCIEYDGSAHHGWQKQPKLRTIQESLEQALSQIADHDVHLNCAGRTDTGVHATAQIVDFETTAKRDEQAWVYGVNSRLTNDVSVRWAKVVDDEFHSRYQAIWRRYCYLIYNNPVRSAVLRRLVTWHYRPLDHEQMANAAECLVGEHDFTSFRSTECQSNTPMRQVHGLSVKRIGDLIILDITANAFLHHMVRNIAGTLINVGIGRHEPEWVQEVLQARDRRLGGETAPAYGLYLIQVQYPEQFELPTKPELPFFLQYVTI